MGLSLAISVSPVVLMTSSSSMKLLHVMGELFHSCLQEEARMGCIYIYIVIEGGAFSEYQQPAQDVLSV